MQSHSSKLILVTIMLMDLLAGMEFDLFVPSFPELQAQFTISPFWVEALLSSNFIGYCLSLLLVGSLADHYGRKPILMLGLAIFILGSIFCCWTTTYELLLIGRFLQGFGIAAPATLSFLIIADTYPLEKQPFLMAMLNGSMNTAIALAPIIGSYITWYFQWRGNFIALLIFGALTLLMTLLFIPKYPPLSLQKGPLSLRGYFPIFQAKPLLLLILNFILMFAPYWIFVGISPLLYMQDLKVSLLHFGYYQGALAFTFGLGSILYGLIIHRYNPKRMLQISWYISIIGIITIIWTTMLDSKSPLLITLSLLAYNISAIIPTIILYPLTLNWISEAKGRISSLLQGGRLIFSSLCLQIAGHYYTGSFRSIGVILSVFIFIGAITQFLVNRHKSIIALGQKTNTHAPL